MGYLSRTLIVPETEIMEAPDVRFEVSGYDEFWDTEENRVRYRPRTDWVDPKLRLRTGHYLLPQGAWRPAQDLRPSRRRNPAMVAAGERIQLREGVQEAAFAALVEQGDGFLKLGPGKGKTVLALRVAAHWGEPTLVFVDNGGLLQQWKERIATFYGTDDVGMVQGPFPSWSWKGLWITLAIFNSFHLQYSKGRVPLSFLDHFGTVIWDEAQTAKAETRRDTLSLFSGRRIGLSATPGRDGTENFLYLHLGAVAYEDLRSDLNPKVFFKPIDVPPTRAQVPGDKRALTMLATKILSYSRKRGEPRTAVPEYFIAVRDHLLEMRKLGRTVIFLSPRTSFGHQLAEAVEGAVFIDQQTPARLRDEVLNSSDIVGVSSTLGEKALDRVDLDTLCLTFPVGKAAKDRAMQSAGRVLRYLHGKKDPWVFAFYPNTAQGREYARHNQKLFEELGYDIQTAAKTEPPKPGRKGEKGLSFLRGTQNV